MYMYIHIYLYLSLSIYIYIHVHTCVYLSLSIYIYTYIYIYTHYQCTFLHVYDSCSIPRIEMFYMCVRVISYLPAARPKTRSDRPSVLPRRLRPPAAPMSGREIYIYIPISLSLSISLSLYIYIYTYVYIYIYVCMHIYIYIYTYTYMYEEFTWLAETRLVQNTSNCIKLA